MTIWFDNLTPKNQTSTVASIFNDLAKCGINLKLILNSYKAAYPALLESIPTRYLSTGELLEEINPINKSDAFLSGEVQPFNEDEILADSAAGREMLEALMHTKHPTDDLVEELKKIQVTLKQALEYRWQIPDDVDLISFLADAQVELNELDDLLGPV